MIQFDEYFSNWLKPPILTVKGVLETMDFLEAPWLVTRIFFALGDGCLCCFATQLLGIPSVESLIK